jgi:spermidine synthase
MKTTKHKSIFYRLPFPLAQFNIFLKKCSLLTKAQNRHPHSRAMKPTLKIATTKTPDGETMTLFKHDADYSIKVGCQELMTSRAHESELELARLGCARIATRQNPTVLIGGLGMGYTLRETLDLLQPEATVVVSELIPDVVQWNRDILGELNNLPLSDPRVALKVCDVMQVIQQSEHAFDAILLDVDNGPRR